MSHYRIRAAGVADLPAFYELAKLTGGGFTNLPADRATLAAKLEKSDAGFTRPGDTPGDDLYVFMLEDANDGSIRGTCQIMGEVGRDRPFYSYRLQTLTQKSEELGRIFRNQTLNLSTDLEGSTEVGGLFLHPHARAGGLGLLLARSRYLFIRAHRARFGDQVLAELRGVMDQGGHSPFWDAIAGRFFGMSFPEADEFNAVHGTQFIADLMPQTPIYVAMLPEAARAVLGQPHPTGRAALKMLENEGFYFESYVDIFDGGPTVTSDTDEIRTIRDARDLTLAGTDHPGPRHTMLVSHGQFRDFVACYAEAVVEDDRVWIDDAAMRMLGVVPGDRIQLASRQ